MRLLSMHVLSEANACVWSPITLLFKPLLLSLSEAARAPLIALSGVTLAAATASATLSIEAAALALRSLNGTGRSLLCARTADRPVGCDARCRSCVGYAPDQAARRVSSQRPTCDCSACMSSLRLMHACGLR